VDPVLLPWFLRLGIDPLPFHEETLAVVGALKDLLDVPYPVVRLGLGFARRLLSS
jgi:hypothetical protein